MTAVIDKFIPQSRAIEQFQLSDFSRAMSAEAAARPSLNVELQPKRVKSAILRHHQLTTCGSAGEAAEAVLRLFPAIPLASSWAEKLPVQIAAESVSPGENFRMHLDISVLIETSGVKIQ
jgi:hypothetical protein